VRPVVHARVLREVWTRQPTLADTSLTEGEGQRAHRAV